MYKEDSFVNDLLHLNRFLWNKMKRKTKRLFLDVFNLEDRIFLSICKILFMDYVQQNVIEANKIILNLG